MNLDLGEVGTLKIAVIDFSSISQECCLLVTCYLVYPRRSVAETVSKSLIPTFLSLASVKITDCPLRFEETSSCGCSNTAPWLWRPISYDPRIFVLPCCRRTSSLPILFGKNRYSPFIAASYFFCWLSRGYPVSCCLVYCDSQI